ncbi:MAG TPA: phenylalanine--tRNA ligase subunit beta [Methanomassiliicoccales archaeon]|nr:phenylalanine--tRNA ligase subunit beta [Methanomassiliicoccales archaeon]
MPVITFSYPDLVALMGKEVPVQELIETIPMMGADFHHYDEVSGELGIEFFPDRPDLYSVEGVARALRTFYGFERGMKTYPVEKSGISMRVDPSIRDVRPYVVAGVVKGVTMSDYFIRSMMEVQEKLHLTVGRKRLKVSIGIHDLDRVTPPFVYKAVDPESFSFVPLAMEESMNLREILEKHPKGVDYAWILKDKAKYPIILDKNKNVLSFPPIINGTLTTVTEETRNFFIDVTGTDHAAISGALNIVATMLAERGGAIQSVRLTGMVRATTPNLKPVRWDLDQDYCNNWLGLNLSTQEMAGCLERMGYEAKALKTKLRTKAPATRMDILHQVDLTEDVAKGYGYAKFGKARPLVASLGAERRIERISDLTRQMMIGNGYYEVTTLTLTSPSEQFDSMRLPRQEVVEVANPISLDHTCLRVSLLPSLLAVLRHSKHRDLPQRIFEVGDVLEGSKRKRRLAAVTIHSKASFTEMKSLVEGVMRDLNVQVTFDPSSVPSYIRGRGAWIYLNGDQIGHFGELHPEVITSHELGYPVVGFELDLEKASAGKLQRIV